VGWVGKELQTKDDYLQPSIDTLLNIAVLQWYGADLP
jgi:hypothetical protein